MSHRSRKHKKRFACGHRGYGRYCHCCAERVARKQKRFSQRRQEREQWQALFAGDAIELSHLPKSIVKKARNVLSALQQGTHYWQMSGKRLEMMRDVIRIPVTRRYRLLCQDDGDQIVPIKVISHEDYNPLTRGPKRFLSRLLSRKP
ncbi:hypothetical protein IQ254_30245 [Nodosilinea sp. LEGE 07088]|uniref:DUF7682 family zinc-binding protein n=1 Tax=Nodosilinea sp. LEGE 07088 TaxID=2777968 RepID=UPI001881BE6B|nr:hypothetical protein [Nodosilinea sp. LEGE 07088]MBE9141424.1 hypothetical protein [Nodosilinea sp. LEGE 07088]